MSMYRRASLAVLMGIAAAVLALAPAGAHDATASAAGGPAYGYVDVREGHRLAASCASSRGGTLNGFFYLSTGRLYLLPDVPGGDCATQRTATIAYSYACSVNGCGPITFH
jgi:hypothetical protein